jgi:uncharacterized protein YjbI with pentapeptide repeats
MAINLSEILHLHSLYLQGNPDGSQAKLRDADLRGANLCGANLYGADLRDANLRGANLRGANLRGANLRGANLCGANLYGADLRDANLCGANLYGANLCGANLYGANLYGANLRDAGLRGAKLCGVTGLPIASDSQERLKAVAQQVLDQPDSLQMGDWHSKCGTTHCLAGWAIHQAGPIGEILEELHGPDLAGLLLLGTEAAEHFYESNFDVVSWLGSIAQQPA